MKFRTRVTVILFLVGSGIAGCAGAWHPGCNCGGGYGSAGGGYGNAGATYGTPAFGSQPLNDGFVNPQSPAGAEGSGGR